MLCFWGDGRRIGLRGRRILFFHWFRHIRAGRGEADRHCLSERASSLREGGSASPFPTNKYLCGYLQPRLRGEPGALLHLFRCNAFSHSREAFSRNPAREAFPGGASESGQRCALPPWEGGENHEGRGGRQGAHFASYRVREGGAEWSCTLHAGQTWPNGMFQRGAKAATDVP